jgi:hypothetical protein
MGLPIVGGRIDSVIGILTGTGLGSLRNVLRCSLSLASLSDP